MPPYEFIVRPSVCYYSENGTKKPTRKPKKNRDRLQREWLQIERSRDTRSWKHAKERKRERERERDRERERERERAQWRARWMRARTRFTIAVNCDQSFSLVPGSVRCFPLGVLSCVGAWSRENNERTSACRCRVPQKMPCICSLFQTNNGKRESEREREGE